MATYRLLVRLNRSILYCTRRYTMSSSLSFSSSRSLSSSPVSSLPQFETLLLTRPADYVVQVEINRPDKRNAMNKTFWKEMVECFNELGTDVDCRSIVISAAGKAFTSGLDLTDAAGDFLATDKQDTARVALHLKENVLVPYQKSFTSIEKCRKPVIAAVHGACVGGGIDLITACDIRVCTEDAWFQIKEVDIGLAADVGTLQRLPKIVGNESMVRELVYTARKFTSEEAHAMNLISHIFPDKEAMMDAALKMAALIATKSPVAVQGSKVNLNYSRDHTVDESLDYMATWNMAMLQTEDLMKAIQGQLLKEPPTFSKL